MKLELKQVSGQVPPDAIELLRKTLRQYETLNQEKDAELEEFVEEHCELKFTEMQKINKKFKIQLTVQKDEGKKAELQQQWDQLKAEKEVEMNGKLLEGKAEIKERFNQDA